MGPSWLQILIVLVLLVLLFGRGKISGLMGDVAQGIKSFKKGMSEDADEAPAKPAPKVIEHERAKPTTRGKTGPRAKATRRRKSG
jgi:sec-independent protein translocase protein TatA